MIINNGKIVTMAGEVIENGCIHIKSGKIHKIYKKPMSRADVGEQVIDAAGLWVMPGLIEAHCHIGITEEKKGMEGNDCNEATNPCTPQLRGMDGINPLDPAFHNAIQAGITTVMAGPGSSNVVGGQFVCMKTHGRNIKDMVILEPAALKCAFGENPKNTYGTNGNMPATRMGIAAMLREELYQAVQYKHDKEKAILDGKGEEFAIDFHLEPYLPVLNGVIPLKAHVHRTDDILTAIRIAKEFGVAMTLDHCTEGHLIAEEIAASGYPAILGPDLASRNKPEVQNADFKTAGVLYEHGVLFALTTDHPVSLIQYLPVCAAMAVKRGLPMEEGLKAITINAAKICGVSHRVGSIEEGKDADISIFTGNPMEIFTEAVYTIINGEVVYQKEETDLL